MGVSAPRDPGDFGDQNDCGDPNGRDVPAVRPRREYAVVGAVLVVVVLGIAFWVGSQAGERRGSGEAEPPIPTDPVGFSERSATSGAAAAAPEPEPTSVDWRDAAAAALPLLAEARTLHTLPADAGFVYEFAGPGPADIASLGRRVRSAREHLQRERAAAVVPVPAVPIVVGLIYPENERLAYSVKLEGKPAWTWIGGRGVLFQDRSEYRIGQHSAVTSILTYGFLDQVKCSGHLTWLASGPPPRVEVACTGLSSYLKNVDMERTGEPFEKTRELQLKDGGKPKKYSIRARKVKGVVAQGRAEVRLDGKKEPTFSLYAEERGHAWLKKLDKLERKTGLRYRSDSEHMRKAKFSPLRYFFRDRLRFEAPPKSTTWKRGVAKRKAKAIHRGLKAHFRKHHKQQKLRIEIVRGDTVLAVYPTR